MTTTTENVPIVATSDTGLRTNQRQWSAPSQTSTSGSKLFSRQFPKRKFLVEGLLQEGDLALLVGRPKSGKSWLMLEMAQALDSGTPFLGRETNRARVYYFALEDGERRVADRLHIRNWNPVNACFDFGPLFLGDGLLPKLQAIAEDYDVIFIDTLRAACAGIDENDNNLMGKVIQDLATLAHKTGTTFVVTHHTKKGETEDPFDAIRGAGAIRGAYDLGMLLRRDNGSPLARMLVESRDVEVPEMQLRFEAATGWSLVAEGELQVNTGPGWKVLDAIRKLGNGKTISEIADHLGITPQSAGQQLKSALKKGWVTRTSTPTEGKKPKDLWSLARGTN